MAALATSRTGRMTDIVATIQARAGPHHPRRRAGRAGRSGRPGHRQDRRRAAPRRLPALRRSVSGSRSSGVLVVGPNLDVPALHRAGAPLTRRDRRAAVDPRGAASRHHRHRRRSRPAPRCSRATSRMAAVMARAVYNLKKVPTTVRDDPVRPLRADAPPARRHCPPGGARSRPASRTTWPDRASPAPCCASSPARSKASTRKSRRTCSASCSAPMSSASP